MKLMPFDSHQMEAGILIDATQDEVGRGNRQIAGIKQCANLKRIPCGLIQINARRGQDYTVRLMQNHGANMTEASERDRAIGKQSDTATRVTDTNKDALHFMMGVQTAIFQEMVFAGYEMFDRARTEMHLLAELASKNAQAHSVGDIRTMWNECSRHQFEFLRRDYERHLRHGEKMIENASKLFNDRPQGV